MALYKFTYLNLLTCHYWHLFSVSQYRSTKLPHPGIKEGTRVPRHRRRLVRRPGCSESGAGRHSLADLSHGPRRPAGETQGDDPSPPRNRFQADACVCDWWRNGAQRTNQRPPVVFGCTRTSRDSRHLVNSPRHHLPIDDLLTSRFDNITRYVHCCWLWEW